MKLKIVDGDVKVRVVLMEEDSGAASEAPSRCHRVMVCASFHSPARKCTTGDK